MNYFLNFRRKTNLLSLLLCSIFIPEQLFASICDYRPSTLMGGQGTAAAIAGAGGAAASGATASAMGFYTLVNATTGATMLAANGAGAAALGASGGILAGTSGGIGMAAAIAMAPATIIIAAGTAIAVGGYEGACYFTDIRITDTDEVLAVLSNLAAQSDESYFRLEKNNAIPEDSILYVRNDAGGMDKYIVKNLYIVNGVLKNRDWGFNTVIGKVAFVATEMPAEDAGQGIVQ